MYETRDVLPVDELRGGAQLLGVGPPTLDLQAVGYRLLADGLDRGEGAVAVSVDRSAEAVGAALRNRGAGSLERLAVVDAGVSGALRVLDGAPVDRVRLLFDSLSSMAVYADFDRIFQFVHQLGVQTGDADGLGLSLTTAGTEAGRLDRLRSLTDGTLELREGAEGVEWRLAGGAGGPGRGVEATGEWSSAPEYVADPGAAPAVVDDGATVESQGELSTDDLSSLHDLIERVEAMGYTLTVCNPGSESELDLLADRLEQYGVEVRTVELSTETPTGTAILHRGEEPLAMSPAGELYDAVQFEAPQEAESAAKPAVLERAHRRQYTVDNGGKLRMVRISRLVERRALDVGRGTLHAGFQRLGRVDDELGTQELYERIAGTDVDVHMYGRPGEVPNEEWYTVHAGETPELAESWFVVFDGGGREGTMGALVSEETDPEEYSGFWTYKPDLVRTVEDYLSTAYSAA
ncbi:hypothetical protein BRD10_02980 [Halobacteriales archaeon SW_12_71_31]|nr:MAG: hypothetical protein BRD10_02980 [Halobacteriales archaeon SW_12_71_31]